MLLEGQRSCHRTRRTVGPSIDVDDACVRSLAVKQRPNEMRADPRDVSDRADEGERCALRLRYAMHYAMAASPRVGPSWRACHCWGRKGRAGWVLRVRERVWYGVARPALGGAMRLSVCYAFGVPLPLYVMLASGQGVEHSFSSQIPLGFTPHRLI